MSEQRLIDANKVDPSEVFCGSSDFAQDVRNGVGVLISYQPTIDPEELPIVQELRKKLAECEPVVHAHWIDSPNVSECVICSNCKSDNLSAQVIAPAPPYYKYCPCCGAKMDVVEQ